VLQINFSALVNKIIISDTFQPFLLTYPEADLTSNFEFNFLHIRYDMKIIRKALFHRKIESNFFLLNPEIMANLFNI